MLGSELIVICGLVFKFIVNFIVSQIRYSYIGNTLAYRRCFYLVDELIIS